MLGPSVTTGDLDSVRASGSDDDWHTDVPWSGPTPTLLRDPTWVWGND